MPVVAAESTEPSVNTSYISHEQQEGYYNNIFTVSPEAKLTLQEAGNYLRFCMLNAVDYFGLNVTNGHYAAVVTYYDSEPVDEDALAELLGCAIGYGCYSKSTIFYGVLEMEEDGGIYRNTVWYEMPFGLISNAEKVEYTVETVETVIRNLDLEGKSDYEKILMICQYICDNVEYGVYDSDSYTAYGALKYGLAVCDGYEDLTYALLMEAGLDSACVSGYAGGGSHAWNIVLLDGLYYNLDTTWADDVFYPGMEMDMSWILRGATDFPSHYRDGSYTTDKFNARYPMASTKYDGTPGTLHNCNGVHNYEMADPYSDVVICPTVNSAGKVILTCSWCSIGAYFEMPPLNTEDYNYKVKREATCTEKGMCTYEWKFEPSFGIVLVIPATGHSYVDGICTACGVAGAHEWADATCTAPTTCTLCGATEGSALGHNWTDATCTDPATCVTCGKTEGDALAHTEVIDEAVAATCTATGKTEGKHCSACGAVTVAQQIVPAKGHTEVIDKAEAATCTATGKTEGKHCSVCNTVIVAQQTVPATGHTYDNGVDGTCNVCGIHREEAEDRTVMHMFRMYDPNSGEHFYTGSVEERENLVAAGWNYEGVGFTFSRTTGMPVYRLYDPITGEHLYTMETPVNTGNKYVSSDQYNGRDLYECEGRIWLYEGIAFNSAYDTEVPQYRLRNPNATRGAYHFTSSAIERDNLIAAGWIYEGICFYSSWK